MKIFIMLSLLFSLLFSFGAHAEKMKDFSLPYYQQGEKFTLSEALKGKKILINFWATWCTSCIQELPKLEALKEKYGNDVTFVAVNAGEKNNLMARFFKKYKFSYVHLKDEDRSFSKSVGVDSLPVTMVIDKDMNIIYRDVVPPTQI